MDAILTVDNLKKSFGQTEVLKGVSFSIERGEIFGFLGRNGAGKSTLIHILTGVMHQTKGEFTLLGQPSKRLDNVKCKIGVFPDVDNFYSDLNAIQHLRFFSKLHKVNVKTEQLEEQLALVGLLKDKHKKVKNFSFGMKKKLGVAQALVGNPEFVILDEPTSGLDPESAIQMRELIKKIASQGKTILLTSHNLDELEKMSTKIAILKEGQISVNGTMEKLRQQYQQTLKVHITLDQPLDKEEIERLHVPYQMDKNILTISVQTKKELAAIIRRLVTNGYDVYKVEHQEKTLEEIFLENGE